ncbi:MAG TPA: DUF5606 domain-containing protein [Cytophagaceae bacterium]|jgi:hypothetical protein|nr:DUF5606 domain-containing protein [Cytophagaceae bacterium]
MNLKDIASISGKSGLFKVIKPTRTGVILETIDGLKSRVVANANNRVSILQEISIYTTGTEASIPLEKVFTMIYEKFNKSLKVDSKSDPHALKSFLADIVPDYDTERVYNSDIKKMVSWYLLIANHLPEIFTSEPEEKEKTEEKPKKEPSKSEAIKSDGKEEKKPAAKTKSKTTKSK